MAIVTIYTDKTPYILERSKRPSTLKTSILSEKDWNDFCDKFDKKLQPIEETMALLKVVTVGLLLFYLLTTVGLVIRYLLVDDQISDTMGLIVSICLFVTYLSLFGFHALFIFVIIVKRLQEGNASLDTLCQELSESTSAHTTAPIEFKFRHSLIRNVVWSDTYRGQVEIAAASHKGAVGGDSAPV